MSKGRREPRRESEPALQFLSGAEAAKIGRGTNSRTIRLSVNGELYARIATCAQDAGLSVNEWIRVILNEAAVS